MMIDLAETNKLQEKRGLERSFPPIIFRLTLGLGRCKYGVELGLLAG